MYEIKLNIEEQYLATFINYLESLKSVQIEKIIKKRQPVARVSQLTKNEELLLTLPDDDPLRQFIKPLREHVTAEQLIKEQNYKGTDWRKLDDLAKILDIQESSTLSDKTVPLDMTEIRKKYALQHEDFYPLQELFKDTPPAYELTKLLCQ